jgi:hypothetical protein
MAADLGSGGEHVRTHVLEPKAPFRRSAARDADAAGDLRQPSELSCISWRRFH